MSIGRVVKILKKLYLLIWLQIFTSVNYIGCLGVVGYIEGVGLVKSQGSGLGESDVLLLLH